METFDGIDRTTKLNGFRTKRKEKVFGIIPVVGDGHEKTLRRGTFLRLLFLPFDSIFFLLFDLVGSFVSGKRRTTCIGRSDRPMKRRT